MKGKHNKINRRNFLKSMASVSSGSALACTKVMASQRTDPNAEEQIQKPKLPQVPRRMLGKTS